MMVRKPILIIVLFLLITSLACSYSFNVDLPVINITPGALETVDINIPIPQDPPEITYVELDFAAGELKLSPGAGDALINGLATYNIAPLKPIVEMDGEKIQIR